MSAILKVYDDRIMPSSSEERACPMGCAFCYSPDLVADQQYTRPETVDKLKEEIALVLRETGTAIRFINAGCTTDLFANQQAGLQHLKFLAGFGRNVSFSTRAALAPATMDSLATIHHELKSKGAGIAMQISFVSGVDCPDLEKNVPKVERRISTIRGLAEREMPIGVIIRPLLPPSLVATPEILDLISATRDHVNVYTIGSEFIFTDEMANRMGLDPYGEEMGKYSEHQTAPKWAESSPKWHRYIDPRGSEIIGHIRNLGRSAFSRSVDAYDLLIGGKR